MNYGSPRTPIGGDMGYLARFIDSEGNLQGIWARNGDSDVSRSSVPTSSLAALRLTPVSGEGHAHR